MTDKVIFDLVAPDRLVSSSEVDMVVVPGTEGDFGVLKGHSPLMSSLRAGLIEIHDNGSVIDRLFVPGGFAEVNETKLTILAEEAENLKDVSVESVRQDLQNAQEDFDDAKDDVSIAIAKKKVDTLTVKLSLL